jgi:hypothetical protein
MVDVPRELSAEMSGLADKVLSIFVEAPPTVLHHYTDVGGFSGIVGNGVIWASELHYLNDSQEFAHALGIARKVLQDKEIPGLEDGDQDLLGRLGSELCENRPLDIYVASFTEVDDQLSQWRAYGGGGGYCLGFETTSIQALCKEQGFRLMRCIYDEGKQKVAVGAVLGVIVKMLHNAREGKTAELLPSMEERTCALCVNAVSHIAPFLKHRAFAEEREWRIVSQPFRAIPDRLGFLPRGSVLAPYIEFNLRQDGALGLKQVVIGPTPAPDLAESGAMRFARAKGVTECTYRRSNAPWRDW